MSTVDKEELVQKAKLAEQSERWVSEVLISELVLKIWFWKLIGTMTWPRPWNPSQRPALSSQMRKEICSPLPTKTWSVPAGELIRILAQIAS